MAGFSLILYPFVAGVSGMEQGMTPQQWIDYGAILRQVHGTALPPYLEQIMRRETFVPSGATTLRHLDAHLNERDFDDDPTGRALAGFWRERREEIAKLVARAEELGRRLAGQGLPFVLCHADIHTANVLLDSRGNVWIVDWDETVLAPRERDLMFAVGGIIGGVVGPREEELFFQGYGPTTVDPLGLAYYRYAWAVSDIAAWGSEVVFRPDLGPASRKASADSFMRLFLPGNIASLAFASGV
jgi:spectinomycin phosphotransferase